MAVTMIQVTGQSITTLDGTPLNGFVLFSVETSTGQGQVVDVQSPPAVFLGSADATVANGVMEPISIPATDSVTPPFTYTITLRISGPDGDSDNQVLTGVQIPSTLGATVDLAALI
jgi:hypothetical protein